MKRKTSFRDYEIRAEEINEKERTVVLSFASDEPVLMRYEYGHEKVYEILSHDDDRLDYSRLEDGGPLLLNHDRYEQIGVIRKCWLKAKKKKKRSYAEVQFSRSTRAEEIFQDVVDGIRKNVSTGYNVYEARQVAENNEVPVFEAIRWEPLEVSIVPIGADKTVGVGRQSDIITEFDMSVIDSVEKHKKNWNLNIDIRI